MLRKTVAIVLFALVVIPLALECYCIFHSDLFQGAPDELRPAGMYPQGEAWVSYDPHGASPVWESRYRLGVSRDEVRKNFAFGARLIASGSRPDRGWSAKGKGQPGLADYVLEFERGRRGGLVAGCDVYDDGLYHHVLFFDDAGSLVGAQRFPRSICLSACVDSAKLGALAVASSPTQIHSWCL